MAGQVLGRSITLKWQCHRFLLWGLIFGRSGLGHIYPIPHSDFTDSYSDSSYLADQVLTYLPSPPNSEFTDSYSESSYLAGQGLADLSPPLSTHFTDSYSESSYLDNQVLIDPPLSLCLKWQFHRLPTLRAHIWETRSWLDLPSPNQTVNFPDSHSDSSYLADQVLADLPLSSGNFTDSYSENSYFADQVLVDPPLLSPGLKWQFHRFLIWVLISGRPGLGRSSISPSNNFTDSYSENSYLADKVLGDLPSQMAMSQIPVKSLWGLIFRRQGLGRSSIPQQTVISQIPNLITPNWQTRSREIYHTQVAISQIPPLRTHIWQVIPGQREKGIYPIPHSDFTDSYSDSSYLADQVLTYLPQSPSNSEFHRFLLLRVHILAGQVMADLSPPLSTNFTDSYSESSYLDNQVLISPHQTVISQIPTLRVSYLAGQVFTDLPPSWELIFTDSDSESSYLDN